MNGTSAHSARKAFAGFSGARADASFLGVSYRSWRFS
jgi:hypothetical protein